MSSAVMIPLFTFLSWFLAVYSRIPGRTDFLSPCFHACIQRVVQWCAFCISSMLACIFCFCPKLQIRSFVGTRSPSAVRLWECVLISICCRAQTLFFNEKNFVNSFGFFFVLGLLALQNVIAFLTFLWPSAGNITQHTNEEGASGKVVPSRCYLLSFFAATPVLMGSQCLLTTFRPSFFSESKRCQEKILCILIRGE